jgi:hypothetical protein
MRIRTVATLLTFPLSREGEHSYSPTLCLSRRRYAGTEAPLASAAGSSFRESSCSLRKMLVR